MLALLATLLPTVVAAQVPENDDVNAVRTILGTSVGAFPTLAMPMTALGGDAFGAHLSRWGLEGRKAHHSIGLSYEASRPTGHMSVIVGALVPGCSGCKPIPMIGGESVAVTGGETEEGKRLAFRLRLAAGLARESQSTYAALGIAPSMMIRGQVRGRTAAAFVGPASIIGIVREGGKFDASQQLTVSGGAALRGTHGRAVALAVQRLLGARITSVGASVSLPR